MKLIASLSFLFTISLGFSQTLPLDFESTTLTYAFTDFDGGVATKIANPQISGINTSATVVQIVKNAGEIWGGSKITLPAPVDLSTERVFKMKVFAPVAGIQVLIKFEGAGPFNFEKLSAPITTANVWEELTFDFSAIAVNSLNDEISFMFDFGTMGDGSANSTYLFDDVTQSAGSGPLLDLPVLPMDFESANILYSFSDFGGAGTTVMANPDPTGINTSATVAQMIKYPGETYAGTIIQMAGPIDFSTNKIVKLKVWSPVAGIRLLLKFEGSPVDFDNGAFEVDTIITVANAWEELTFDYNSPTLFPPVNNNDTQIAFFFDFGTQGDGTINSTYYVDDVAFAEVVAVPSVENGSLQIYPNPAQNELTVAADVSIQSVTLFNLAGEEVIEKHVNGFSTTLAIDKLPAGVYEVAIKTEIGETTEKFVKE